MPSAEFAQNTPSCWNCRTIAVPKNVIDAPMRGMTASNSGSSFDLK